jgi:hypothetical protein
MFSVARRFSELQKSYINFLVTPKALRDPDGPKNDTEWANANHIRQAQLTKWRNDPEFQIEWQKRLARARVTPDRINDIYDGLYEAATKGNVQAAKLYLESNNRLNPPRELLDESKVTSVSTLSDDELAALLAQAAESELAKRSGADDDDA